MKIKQPDIIFDKDSQALSIEMSKKKSVDSDIQGNVVVDYDSKGNIVRINLYQFSFDLFRSNLRVLKSFASTKVF